jgi:spore maturation protein CgeB
MKIVWLGLEHVLGIERNHNVLIMNKDTFNKEIVREFEPDLVIEREFNDGKSVYHEEIKFIRDTFPECKIAVWLIDTHVAYERHIEYAKLFDYVFLAISKYVPLFEARLSYYDRVFWLPLCFPAPHIPKQKPLELLYNPLTVREYAKREQLYPIGFVGRFDNKWLAKRQEMLDFVEDKYGKMCHFVTDYNTVYQTMSKCIIMLNMTYADDLNYRVFEALACGNILISNPVPDMYKINGLDEKIVMYKTLAGLHEKIYDLLDENYYIEKVEHNKYWIETYHTLSNRIKSMLDMIDRRKQIDF